MGNTKAVKLLPKEPMMALMVLHPESRVVNRVAYGCSCCEVNAHKAGETGSSLPQVDQSLCVKRVCANKLWIMTTILACPATKNALTQNWLTPFSIRHEYDTSTTSARPNTAPMHDQNVMQQEGALQRERVLTCRMG